MENKILQGDVLEMLKMIPSESVDCIITSPPYFGLRDYGIGGQIGLENSLEEYILKMLSVTAELKRVLKKTGVMWWNHGDSYAGAPSGPSGKGSTLNGGKKTQNDFAKKATGRSRRGGSTIPDKSLTLQAHRLAIRMVDEQGWILRNQVIWHKPNVMPASVKDRFTVDFEPVFFFAKSPKYFFEQQFEPLSQVSINRAKYGWKSTKANASVAHGRFGISVEKMGERFANPKGRNKRAVWKIPTSTSRHAHVAMFPEALLETMVRAGSPRGGGNTGPFLWLGDHRGRCSEFGQEIYRY